MISTFQALAVAVLAVLPGASYTYAYERVVGGFGVSFTDRLVRFLAASAIFQAVLSGLTLLAYREYIVSGQLSRGEINAGVLELVALAYVLVPTAAGTLVGRGQQHGWTWVRWLVGDSPEPRAWDYLWRSGARGVVRIKLKSGTWLAGLYAPIADPVTGQTRRSYAAGYPEDGDLYLSLQLQVNLTTGLSRRIMRDSRYPSTATAVCSCGGPRSSTSTSRRSRTWQTTRATRLRRPLAGRPRPARGSKKRVAIPARAPRSPSCPRFPPARRPVQSRPTAAAERATVPDPSEPAAPRSAQAAQRSDE